MVFLVMNIESCFKKLNVKNDGHHFGISSERSPKTKSKGKRQIKNGKPYSFFEESIHASVLFLLVRIVGNDCPKNGSPRFPINRKPTTWETKEMTIHKDIRHSRARQMRLISCIFNRFGKRIVAGHQYAKEVICAAFSRPNSDCMFFWPELHGRNQHRFCIGAA